MVLLSVITLDNSLKYTCLYQQMQVLLAVCNSIHTVYHVQVWFMLFALWNKNNYWSFWKLKNWAVHTQHIISGRTIQITPSDFKFAINNFDVLLYITQDWLFQAKTPTNTGILNVSCHLLHNKHTCNWYHINYIKCQFMKLWPFTEKIKELVCMSKLPTMTKNKTFGEKSLPNFS